MAKSSPRQVSAAAQPASSKVQKIAVIDICSGYQHQNAALQSNRSFETYIYSSRTLQVSNDAVPLCVAISSGLFLYRLLAIFSHSDDESRMPPKVARPSNQADSVWHVELAHTATKAVVRFGDYRGAAAVWAGDCGNEVEMGSFEEHLVSLLELLCSNKCPHTYDGTLAGCVA